MTKLTIKPLGGKGATVEADSQSVLRTLFYYSAHPQAVCYYKNNQGWAKLSASVASRYAHVIGHSERVVVAIVPSKEAQNAS